MIDRSPAASRPSPRNSERAARPSPRRTPLRPTVEALEGRALLSTGGSPDFSYNPTSVSMKGFAPITFRVTNEAESLVTGEAIQSDGKVLAVGYLHGINNMGVNPVVDTIAVARRNVDSSADTSFGTAGSVFLPGPGNLDGQDHGVAVAVQPDGKIIVVGNVSGVTQGSPGEVAAYRLNADGSVDTTFGAAGAVFFTFKQGTTALDSSATALAIQSDGKIVIGGVVNTVDAAVALARLNADGSVDTTFGTAGQALVSIKDGAQTLTDAQGVAGLVVQPDGKIAFSTTVNPALNAGTQIAVGRLNTDGTADASFATAGQYLFANSSADTAGPLAIQADGQLIVTGAYFSFDANTTVSTTHFDVYRLTAAGTLDATFAGTGEATPVSYIHTQSPGATGDVDHAYVDSVLIQPDGRILVGGTVSFGNTGVNVNPTIVRLNANGTPDLRYGTGGRNDIPVNIAGTISPNNSILHSVYGLAVQADGKILAALIDGVARLLPIGAANDFDEDGKTDPAIYLPSLGLFAYRPSAGGPDVLVPFGQTGSGLTLPAPAAYDGSGVTELAVYLPALGKFGIRPYFFGGTGGDELVPLGPSGTGQSIPAPADYTGSGQTEMAVYLPALGAFFRLVSSSINSQVTTTIPFGTPGPGNSIPVPADYTGVGHDEVAVYLPLLGAFAYRPADGGTTHDRIIPFGTDGYGKSIPVPGDYDGFGKTELAVYLPDLGAFAYRPSSGVTTHDRIIPFGMPGAGNSIPMPGDYDGSGHLELGVYIPSLAEFIYRPAGGGPDVVLPFFGIPGTAGQTIPFTTTEGATIATEAGGNGHAITRALPATMLDFVPEIAGQAKKKDAKVAASTLVQGQV